MSREREAGEKEGRDEKENEYDSDNCLSEQE